MLKNKRKVDYFILVLFATDAQRHRIVKYGNWK